MNIDHIEAFLYIINYKSFNKAASALDLSQPTITARIKALENELQAQLFTRNGKEIDLTEKGKEFIPYATQIVSTYHKGKQIMEGNNQNNVISIGANAVASNYFFPYLLPKLREAYPHIKWNIIMRTTPELCQLLFERKLDIAFTAHTESNDIEAEEILKNNFILVAHREMVGDLSECLTFEELAEFPLIGYECGAFRWRTIEKVFELDNLNPDVIAYTDNVEVAKTYVENQLGVVFLPYLCVKKEIEEGKFQEIQLERDITVSQSIFMCKGIVNPIYEPIIENIRHLAKQFGNEF